MFGYVYFVMAAKLGIFFFFDVQTRMEVSFSTLIEFNLSGGWYQNFFEVINV